MVKNRQRAGDIQNNHFQRAPSPSLVTIWRLFVILLNALLPHRQHVHFWTYPRILTVLVKWRHPANGLLDGILTSIKRTRINSTTDSMKRYSAIWPIPGRSQSKPWSVYFTFDNSHRKLALVKRTQDFVINLQPHPQGNSRYVNEWRRRGTERDVTSEKTGNDWELVWFYNHGKQEDSCYN